MPAAFASPNYLLLLLLAISVVALVNGLYKLLDNMPMVPNAKKGMVYLFQPPRTSTCPSLAALSLKVETWLMWHGIPFHRLSNQFFLGSHSRGTVPFIELDGEHIYGSDEIIEKLSEKYNIKNDMNKLSLAKIIKHKIYRRNGVWIPVKLIDELINTFDNKHADGEKKEQESVGGDKKSKSEQQKGQIGNDDLLFIQANTSKGKEHDEGTDREQREREGEREMVSRELAKIYGKYKCNTAEGIIGKMREEYAEFVEMERKLRKTIDEQMHKILMFDRAYNTDFGKGLDFMLSDEGIIQQIIPLLIPNALMTVPGVRNGRFEITLNSDTWKAYFDVSSRIQQLEKDGEEIDQQTKSMAGQFLKNHMKKAKSRLKVISSRLGISLTKKMDWNEWETFDKWLREKVITKALASVFKASSGMPGNFENKLNELLALNSLDGRQYSAYTEREMLAKFKEKLAEVIEGLEGFKEKATFLTTERPFSDDYEHLTLIPALASLFSFAVQFFESPLNYYLFMAYSWSHDANVILLRKFMEKVKRHLRLNRLWTTVTSRPWPLNWRSEQYYGDKYNGPFQFDYDVDENNILSLLDGQRKEKQKVNAANQHLLESLPGELQKAVGKLVAEANQRGRDWKERNERAKDFLKAMVAYIKGYPSNNHDVKMMVYDAIIEYNEEIVRQNVLQAIGKAKAIVGTGTGKGATQEQQAKAMEAVSETSLGDEY